MGIDILYKYRHPYQINDWDCGGLALNICFELAGRGVVPATAINEELQSNPTEGTNPNAFEKPLRDRNIAYKVHKHATFKELETILDENRFALINGQIIYGDQDDSKGCFWQRDELNPFDEDWGHYSVALGIQTLRKEKNIIVADPAIFYKLENGLPMGLRYVPKSIFVQRWHDNEENGTFTEGWMIEFYNKINLTKPINGMGKSRNIKDWAIRTLRKHSLNLNNNCPPTILQP